MSEPSVTLFNTYAIKGMDLRDYFAGKAIPVAYKYWMADYYHPDHPDHDVRTGSYEDLDRDVCELIADSAYALADAMMKARESK